MKGAVQTPEVDYEVARRDFKYYIFDWDDNILHMPTRIHLEHRNAETGEWEPVSVSTAVFALVRTDSSNYRLPKDGGRAAAFRDFADDMHATAASEKRAFIRDTRAALARIKAGEKPGPSFETLRKTLREGRIFAIVTARGHASKTIRDAVKIFIDTVLTPEDRAEMMRSLRGYRWWLDKKTEFGTDAEELDYYLSMCRYHAVTHPDFHAWVEGDQDFGGKYATASSERRPELTRFRRTHFPRAGAHGRARASGVRRLLGRRRRQCQGGFGLHQGGACEAIQRLQIRRLRHVRPVAYERPQGHRRRPAQPSRFLIHCGLGALVEFSRQ